uniref:Mitochondria-eating protein n=1 Tax=Monodelphis domestica TaxID=13616 RepID=A0A5F8GAD3_MONDO
MPGGRAPGCQFYLPATFTGSSPVPSLLPTPPRPPARLLPSPSHRGLTAQLQAPAGRTTGPLMGWGWQAGPKPRGRYGGSPVRVDAGFPSLSLLSRSHAPSSPPPSPNTPGQSRLLTPRSHRTDLLRRCPRRRRRHLPAPAPLRPPPPAGGSALSPLAPLRLRPHPSPCPRPRGQSATGARAQNPLQPGWDDCEQRNRRILPALPEASSCSPALRQGRRPRPGPLTPTTTSSSRLRCSEEAPDIKTHSGARASTGQTQNTLKLVGRFSGQLWGESEACRARGQIWTEVRRDRGKAESFKFKINTCDQNLNCCCEMLELNSKIQGQLFTILNLIAQEGGHYAGVEIIKSRFLPWLGTCFSNSSIAKCPEGNLILFQESCDKDKQLRELSGTREREIHQLDSELNSTRVQLSVVQQELKTLQTQDICRKICPPEQVFNDNKYRRSCDSDFTAPLVFYHVWPALVENDTVIMKGEVVTTRAAFVRSHYGMETHQNCFPHRFLTVFITKRHTIH